MTPSPKQPKQGKKGWSQTACRCCYNVTLHMVATFRIAQSHLFYNVAKILRLQHGLVKFSRGAGGRSFIRWRTKGPEGKSQVIAVPLVLQDVHKFLFILQTNFIQDSILEERIMFVLKWLTFNNHNTTLWSHLKYVWSKKSMQKAYGFGYYRKVEWKEKVYKEYK